MSMDLQPNGDGRLHFSMGPVERWIVGVGAAALVAILGWYANSITTRLDSLAEAQGALKTQQAVTNQQLVTLNLQLADVPTLTRQIAELKVRVDAHDEDIRELRTTRSLR
jgi:hypothetical protein